MGYDTGTYRSKQYRCRYITAHVGTDRTLIMMLLGHNQFQSQSAILSTCRCTIKSQCGYHMGVEPMFTTLQLGINGHILIPHSRRTRASFRPCARNGRSYRNQQADSAQSIANSHHATAVGDGWIARPVSGVKLFAPLCHSLHSITLQPNFIQLQDGGFWP